MKKLLLSVIFGVLISGNLFATHISGADLTYVCLGGNDYKITFTFYRDCSSGTNPGGNNAQAPLTAPISFRSLSCNQNFTMNFPRIPGTGQEITPICPTQGSACGSSNVLYGIQEYVYQATVTLPPCADWVFSFYTCCRNNPIGTISNPGGAGMYIQATLNNLNAPCNSSPQFSNKPVAILCTSQTFCFNHGALDPDGDSLTYELVTPFTNNSATYVTYLAGYSAQQPLPSIPPVSINTVTGDVCMTPSQSIITVTAVLVKEWRTINGVPTVIGTVLRDMQLNSQPCYNTLPTLGGIDTLNNTGYDPNDTIYHINHCVGIPLSFNIYAYDTDTSQNLTLNWNNGIPGGNWSVSNNNSNNPVGHFSWTPGMGDVNKVNCFTVTVKDDACPYTGNQTLGFCVTVRGSLVDLGPDTLLCQGESITIHAAADTNAVNYRWWLDGTQQSVPLTDTLFVINSTNLTPGLHNLKIEVDDGSTTQLCPGTDKIRINVIPMPDVNLGSDTLICSGEYISLDGGIGAIYTWNTGATSQTITANFTGTYIVTVDGGNGTRCTDSDSLNLTVVNLYPIDLGPDTCSPDAFILDAGHPGLIYTWGPNGETTQTITTSNTNTYTVTITEVANSGCNTTDQIEVKIIPTPIVSLGTDHLICKHQTVILDVFNSGDYSYLWYPTGETTPAIQVHHLNAGQHFFHVIVTGCNALSDSIVIDVELCELTIPNIITPNNDGVNDKFAITNLEFYPGSELLIYNRWGKKVYENPNYNLMDWWDSGDNPDGVYYYILRVYDGESISIEKGSLTILGKIY